MESIGGLSVQQDASGAQVVLPQPLLPSLPAASSPLLSVSPAVYSSSPAAVGLGGIPVYAYYGLPQTTKRPHRKPRRATGLLRMMILFSSCVFAVASCLSPLETTLPHPFSAHKETPKETQETPANGLLIRFLCLSNEAAGDK